jgi:hypothetical protein
MIPQMILQVISPETSFFLIFRSKSRGYSCSPDDTLAILDHVFPFQMILQRILQMILQIIHKMILQILQMIPQMTPPDATPYDTPDDTPDNIPR